jgi:hypothetical protein
MEGILMRKAPYVDREKFDIEFNNCLGIGKLTDELCDMFRLIMIHNLNRKKWSTCLGQESREHIMSDGYLRLATYWKCYKPGKGSPIAYFSQLFECVILNYLNQHKRTYSRLCSLDVKFDNNYEPIVDNVL